eukprot:15478261-Alexandrium_andersonii.AAC.2
MMRMDMPEDTREGLANPHARTGQPHHGSAGRASCAADSSAWTQDWGQGPFRSQSGLQRLR